MAQLQLFETEMETPTFAINIVLYDVSGAPLNPNYVRDLISKAEEIAHREYSLALNITKEQNEIGSYYRRWYYYCGIDSTFLIK